MNINKVLELATLFEKTAQNEPARFSAQSGDVQTALEQAKLWEKSNEVAPLLNAAGIPADTAVAISLVLDKGPRVSFNVALTPPRPVAAARLAGLLKQRYASAMKAAVEGAGLNVMDPVSVHWMNY